VGLAQIAIVGVPDERMGEVGAAFVVKKPGSQLQASDVMAFCKNRIAGYKTPRHVVFVDEMPLAGVGKVKKSELLLAWEREKGATGVERPSL
jgi:fatty-acyl-CoA synthase